MRTNIFCFILLTIAVERSEAGTILFAPESFNEGCTQSWQLTDSDEKTEINFQDLQTTLTPKARAQIKHCRIAWKPLIPAGCYAPSARLEVKGHVWKDSNLKQNVQAQLRLSHDLLGQGSNTPITSVDLTKETFTATIEIPSERFQKAWEEVKLVSHLTLFLRVMNPATQSATSQDTQAIARISIDSVILEPLRSQDCPSARAPLR